MATFTALAKIYSTEYFCNTKVAGLGETFVQQKFFGYTVVFVLYEDIHGVGIYPLIRAPCTVSATQKGRCTGESSIAVLVLMEVNFCNFHMHVHIHVHIHYLHVHM